ncbi:MAG: GNAT family N-acetyltransferase, partial [Candidatus Eisenbacteria bacterium]|nr:GNAT family N-acetyltransferase [Candidatus Eisenbacteria bacterium]
LARHANNRNVWRNLRDLFPYPYTEADAVAFIDKARAQSPERLYAIEVAGEAAGAVGIAQRDDVERISAEIGYWLGEPFWGHGIMTEVVRAVTRHALGTFGLTRVFAVPYEWNPASFRVLEKAGYVCEGVLQRSVIKDGQIIGQRLYAFVVDAPGQLPPEHD